MGDYDNIWRHFLQMLINKTDNLKTHLNLFPAKVRKM